jgi:hypothetical protein
MSELTPIEDALLALAFSLRANPGAYALLLGAGVSAPSGIPTAWGVLQDLTGRVAQLSVENPEDSVTWYETRFREPARYETLLEKLAPTPLERQRLLRDYFEPASEDLEAGRKTPTAAHRAIARLVRAGSVKIILTLNFDRLIEQAVRAEGVEPTVVASPADIEGLAPLHTLDCCIIHLHGDYLAPTSMLNTLTELETYRPATEHLLHRILEDYGLIIAGWSSTYDPALRAAIASHYPTRLTLAWIEPGQPSTEATELRTLKKGLLLPADADTGFGRLADAVAALTARNARHPLTVPVAVETAKRELSGRQVAISLHDRLNREFSRLHELPDFHLASFQSDEPYGGYEAMVGRVEEAATVCCALVATLAYWGDEASDDWWVDELERFSVQARGSGLTKLLSLRLIAGSALFYSAGVAALAARRHELFSRLLEVRRPHPSRNEPQLLAEALDADRVYSEVRGYGTQLSKLVRPLLSESIAISELALDQTWQLFEVLRMAKATMNHPQFDILESIYMEANAALTNAQQAFDDAERSGAGIDEARAERAEAWQTRGRALGAIAGKVPLWRPHILAADRGADERYRSPLAERLASDIAAEGETHPLAKAQLAADPGALNVAVLAVSAAVGREGREMAWKKVPPQGGTVPMEIWLDTGETTGE